MLYMHIQTYVILKYLHFTDVSLGCGGTQALRRLALQSDHVQLVAVAAASARGRRRRSHSPHSHCLIVVEHFDDIGRVGSGQLTGK